MTTGRPRSGSGCPSTTPLRWWRRSRFNIDINPDTGLVRFSRPSGGPILGRAATTGTADAVPDAFPVEPGILPTRWDGSPLHITELTPPWRERAEPTDLPFVSAEPPEATAARLAHTLSCRFEQEMDVWVTSTPDLITVTPESGAGSLISIELTTRPHQLTTTLTAIGLTALPADPPRRRRPLTERERFRRKRFQGDPLLDALPAEDGG